MAAKNEPFTSVSELELPCSLLHCHLCNLGLGFMSFNYCGCLRYAQNQRLIVHSLISRLELWKPEILQKENSPKFEEGSPEIRAKQLHLIHKLRLLHERISSFTATAPQSQNSSELKHTLEIHMHE